MLRIVAVALAAVLSAACTKNSSAPSERGTGTDFFVTSATSVTGNLGGLRGADAICQNLASAVGAGNKTWRAYLSVERDAANGNRPTDARSRIGAGPWFNAEGRAGREQPDRAARAQGRLDACSSTRRAADQRPVGRIAAAGRARHHDRLDTPTGR